MKKKYQALCTKVTTGNSKVLFGEDLQEKLKIENYADNMVMMMLKWGGSAGLPYQCRGGQCQPYYYYQPFRQMHNAVMRPCFQWPF